MINYFRALEGKNGRNTSKSCPFMPNLLQTKPLENNKNLPKVGPAIVIFAQCEGS